MGRHRKPTNILELSGQFKSSPPRADSRENEVQPVARIDPNPPDWMTWMEQQAYKELIARCHPDTLSLGDSAWVEMTACLLSEFRDSRKTFSAWKWSRLQACLIQLGLTPVDRAKASALPSTEENEFAQFAA